jgi:cell wall-associated NlpC family hydrolase
MCRNWWQLSAAAALGALVVSMPALGSSPLDTKRAQAEQVYNEVQQLDENLGRADELMNLANLRLAHVEYEQQVNRHELAVAELNLARSRQMIAQRLVSDYTTPQPSTIDMILGATSLNNVLTRIDNADRLSSLDGQVISQVETFRTAVQRAAHDLVSERAYASRLLAERRDERLSVANELAQRQQLLVSIRGQVSTLEAEAAAEQAAAEQAAETQIRAARAEQLSSVQSQVVGASASTPEGDSVLPASPYGSHVVSIAMSYLGTPYVWGGAAPGGFDCSGLVMYSFAQLGVALPHSSYAMWDYGSPVAENQLEPGDLVFFDDLGHVGLYIGGGEYVDAPYTGAVVRVDSLTTGWAAANYVGARRIT